MSPAIARTCSFFYAGVKQQGDRTRHRGRTSADGVATAPSFEIAIARAYEAASKITFDGMQYRRDIGKSLSKSLIGVYSSRNATIGSIAAARRAGSQLASNPTPSSSATIVMITCGSPGCTW